MKELKVDVEESQGPRYCIRFESIGKRLGAIITNKIATQTECNKSLRK